jgi:hypothetical protein
MATIQNVRIIKSLPFRLHILHLFSNLLTPSIQPVDDVNSYCVPDDGKAPAYMNAVESGWKFNRLEDCCWTHFQWAFRECIGDQFDEVSSLSLI